MASRVYSAFKSDGIMLAIATSLDMMFGRLTRITGEQKFYLDQKGTIELTQKSFRTARDENKTTSAENREYRLQDLADEFAYEYKKDDWRPVPDSSIPVYVKSRKKPVFFLRDDWAE